MKSMFKVLPANKDVAEGAIRGAYAVKAEMEAGTLVASFVQAAVCVAMRDLTKEEACRLVATIALELHPDTKPLMARIGASVYPIGSEN